MIAARRVLSPPAFVLCAFAFSAMATPARAAPCEGRLPSQPGQQFSGTVRYVGDGDGLCVGNSSDPNTWIEVRLADFDAPELRAPDGRLSKSLLEQVAFGQNVACAARAAWPRDRFRPGDRRLPRPWTLDRRPTPRAARARRRQLIVEPQSRRVWVQEGNAFPCDRADTSRPTPSAGSAPQRPRGNNQS